MTDKRSRARRRKTTEDAPQTSKPASNEEELQGPPPREATILHDDRARELEEDLAANSPNTPTLSGGDVDADWKRADSSGEEAVGGSVATPDQDVVDELGEALGVPRKPDEE